MKRRSNHHIIFLKIPFTIEWKPLVTTSQILESTTTREEEKQEEFKKKPKLETQQLQQQ